MRRRLTQAAVLLLIIVAAQVNGATGPLSNRLASAEGDGCDGNLGEDCMNARRCLTCALRESRRALGARNCTLSNRSCALRDNLCLLKECYSTHRNHRRAR